MDGRPFSAQQLLVFCRRAKREHAALFEQWDPAQVRVPEAEVLARAGKEHVSGYLYDHTRDALVSKAVALSRGLAIDAAMTKAEIIAKHLLPALWKTVESEQAKGNKKIAAKPTTRGSTKRKASEPNLINEEEQRGEKEEKKKKPRVAIRGLFKKAAKKDEKKEEEAAVAIAVAAPAAAAAAATRAEFAASAKAATCLICFEDGVNTVVLCCMNSFHVHCLAQWLEKGNANCPSCRAAIHWQLERKKIVIPPMPWLNLNSVARYFPSSDDDDDDDDDDDAFGADGYHFCHDCGEYHS